MRHARIFSLVVALLAWGPALVTAQAVQTEGGNRPFVGVWKLNVQRSQLQRPPSGDFVLYRQYEDHGDGWMFHTVINTSARGVGFLFAAARYDGKQYPVYNGLLLGRFSSQGAATPRTVEFDRISAHQFRWTDRTNGQETEGGVCTVSPDGNTLTITDQAPGRPEVYQQVFDRQSPGSMLPMPGMSRVPGAPGAPGH